MQIINSLEEIVQKTALWLFDWAEHIPALGWGFGAFCLLLAHLIGLRLSHFNHPSRPRWNTLIRHSAQLVLRWPSFIAILAWIVFVLAVLAAGDHFQVLEQTQALLKPRLIATCIGALAGLLLGGAAFYWWLPGLELPQSGLAHPDSKIPTLKGYDPERYFRHG